MLDIFLYFFFIKTESGSLMSIDVNKGAYKFAKEFKINFVQKPAAETLPMSLPD